MMSLTFGLFTQVSGSGPLGPLVLDAVCNKNQENCKISIENEVGSIFSDSAAIVFYFILFDSSSTNRMQLKVKPCKAEIRKGKNESSMQRQYADCVRALCDFLYGHLGKDRA